MLRIRPATLQDLPGTYRVCLLTGDSGRDASTQYANPDLLGHVYVGPYVVGRPGTELVLTDADGVAGYLLAADDTRAFEAWAAEEWWPSLRERYPKRDDGTLEAELIDLIHEPARALDALVDEFPAHLHIDLLGRAQGHGLGRALVEQLLADLHGRRVGGVHLDVAADTLNGIGFYRPLGFPEVGVRPGSVLMGLHLD
ncbi:MAG: GNAT family N-acetyltransferase [Chloroflexi bacterium]|nr:GNAT family N-acetyltransferase [Chloroflexota bacterium]